MRYTTIFIVAVLLLAVHGCKKSTNSTPAKNTTFVSPYYFKCAFNGINYNLTDSTPQYMPFDANIAGGFEDTLNFVLFPSIGLSFTWPTGDTVKESDIMNLKGKTLYFNDTTITPQISYDKDASSATWNSIDTSNTNYNVKITNVTFLKNDSTLGVPVRSYVITGTCTAVMNNGTTTSLLTNGAFNFIICRQNY